MLLNCRELQGPIRRCSIDDGMGGAVQRLLRTTHAGRLQTVSKTRAYLRVLPGGGEEIELLRNLLF